LVDLGRAHPELEIELVTSDAVQNFLARDADVAVRMARPQQRSLVARKVNELHVGAYASRGYIERHGRPADGAALLDHRVIGFDRVETIVEGMRAAGLEVTRESFAFRTDDRPDERRCRRAAVEDGDRTGAGRIFPSVRFG
jgi:DNA-binding transcriptional LysR family regulator